MKKSKLLLASWIIGTLYLIYIIGYFFGGMASSSGTSETIATGLATALVAPHIFFVFLAVLFNLIGWVTKKPWAALTGAILYCVAALAFLLYLPFLLLEIIFSFIAFAKMKKDRRIIDVTIVNKSE